MRNVVKEFDLLSVSRNPAIMIGDDVSITCQEGIIEPTRLISWWPTRSLIAGYIWRRGGYGRLI
jgi:hypothetical protein